MKNPTPTARIFATSLLVSTVATSLDAEKPELPETGVAFKTHQLSDLFFSEGASVGDVNNDGHRDILSGPFWYAGPEFSERHEIYQPAPFPVKGYSKNFLSFTGDIDGDDWTDYLVFGFPGEAVHWYRNPGENPRHWHRFEVMPVADNESPYFGDINGDGKDEIVCSVGGRFALTHPNKNPESPWRTAFISGEKGTGGRYTHGLGVGDINGDGRPDIIDKDNWWEQPDSLDDGTPWRRHRYRFAGKGGAQMFAYDFDGDGDNDIVSSLNGHAYGLAWFEQAEREDGSRTFIRHLIMGSSPDENPFKVAFSQLHALDLADIDGDGTADLITGKRWWAHNGRDPGSDEGAVLYWFRTVPGNQSGKAAFLPYQIHSDSGVGCQVRAADLDGDGRTDVLAGNKKGTFVHFQSGP